MFAPCHTGSSNNAPCSLILQDSRPMQAGRSRGGGSALPACRQPATGSTERTLGKPGQRLGQRGTASLSPAADWVNGEDSGKAGQRTHRSQQVQIKIQRVDPVSGDGIVTRTAGCHVYQQRSCRANMRAGLKGLHTQGCVRGWPQLAPTNVDKSNDGAPSLYCPAVCAHPRLVVFGDATMSRGGQSH